MVLIGLQFKRSLNIISILNLINCPVLKYLQRAKSNCFAGVNYLEFQCKYNKSVLQSFSLSKWIRRMENGKIGYINKFGSGN